MSQLVLEIKSEMVKERLLWLLQHFKKDELEIVGEPTAQNNQAWSDEYVAQNWKAIGMDTHSADSNDNDIKYEAYARFYNEKHSN